jgi:hypothetical protein
MLNELEILAQQWLDEKQTERDAADRRRAIEDRLTELIGKDTADESTTTAKSGEYVVKVNGSVSRKVDGDRLQELAHEHGLFDYLPVLFRWKPELNKAKWEAADASITAPLASAITAKAGRPSFKIEKKEVK